MRASRFRVQGSGFRVQGSGFRAREGSFAFWFVFWQKLDSSQNIC